MSFLLKRFCSRIFIFLMFLLKVNYGATQVDTAFQLSVYKNDYRFLNLKSKHNFKQQIALYTLSIATTAAIVYPLKHVINVQRPDKTDYKSFPSGHTAFAFATAEFLRREFRQTSPWVGIGAYTAAIAIGTQRILYNKHYFTDVIAGAGIGVLASSASFWLYKNRKKTNSHCKKLMVQPYYQQRTVGLYLSKTL